MKFENLKLKDYFPSLADSNASVDAYIQTYDGELDVKDRPAMIIFPGGGYSGTSHRESEPVALAFAARGYQTFVVWYTCAPAQYPQQLIEGAAAVALVRKNAERFELDPKHISVLGFSAGGHLAGMVSSLYGEQVVVDALGEEPSVMRPDSSVLCYPVVTLGESTHFGSRNCLLGTHKEDPEMIRKLSLENAVTENTPPTFIWTTANDNAVPSENSLLLALALKAHNVPYELHVFGDGPHGLSLADMKLTPMHWSPDRIDPRLQSWVDLCHSWLRWHNF